MQQAEFRLYSPANLAQAFHEKMLRHATWAKARYVVLPVFAGLVISCTSLAR